MARRDGSDAVKRLRIYDTLKPFAAELQIGHPAMMKAIGASKKKNDKLDARKTADLVRWDLLPVCYVAPAEMRELRRAVALSEPGSSASGTNQKQNERPADGGGAEYNKRRLHGKKYFTELLGSLEEVPESVKDLLRLSRGALEMFETTQRRAEVHARQTGCSVGALKRERTGRGSACWTPAASP